MEKATSAEVKKSFIVDEAIKTAFKTEQPPDYETLKKLYNQTQSKYRKFTEDALENLINGLEAGFRLQEIESRLITTPNEIGSRRVQRYNQLSWEIGLIALNEIGAWPEMRGIDPRMTTNSIIKTSENICDYFLKTLNYEIPNERKANIESLMTLTESMKSNPFIEKLPLILVPGESIRGEPYKKRVMENHGKYYKHDTSLLGIDSGNTRALTLALMGKENSLAFKGSYKN